MTLENIKPIISIPEPIISIPEPIINIPEPNINIPEPNIIANEKIEISNILPTITNKKVKNITNSKSKSKVKL